MIKQLKLFFRGQFPAAYQWGKRNFRKYPRLVQSIGKRLDWKVSMGPFAGMRYINESFGSRLIPKLIGCYEEELHPWLKTLLGKEFQLVVDIGCAEGYYAVGLARALPAAKVLAYDISEQAQEFCRSMAERNGVASRVQVCGACTAEALTALNLNGSLVICDCEGYEIQLLDPSKAPGLVNSTILVELHDYHLPGITESIQNRFAGTHTIEFVHSTSRDPVHYPVLAGYGQADQQLAVDEDRTVQGRRIVQQWALLSPILHLP